MEPCRLPQLIADHCRGGVPTHSRRPGGLKLSSCACAEAPERAGAGLDPAVTSRNGPPGGDAGVSRTAGCAAQQLEGVAKPGSREPQ